MINRMTAWITSDDQAFTTLEDAKTHELKVLFTDPLSDRDLAYSPEEVAKAILVHQDKIRDILTTTKSSKAKARAVNGGRKRRTAALPAPGAAVTEPPTENMDKPWDKPN